MAEGFEPYHVPQQNKSDKFRVVVQDHSVGVDNIQGCAGLLSVYDPSLLPSDLLTCANLHHQNNCQLSPTHNSACGSSVKEEGVNLMGYVGGIVNASSSSSTLQRIYMDPQSSIHINPSSIQDINSNPFLFTSQNPRVFDQSFNGGEVVVNKPEPLSMSHKANTTGQAGLSLSLSSHHTHQNSLPLKLNLQRYESSIFSDEYAGGGFVVPGIGGGGNDGDSTSNDLSRSSVPLGPFTGYASILRGSRFLKPAQQLLEELCDVGRGINAEKIAADSSMMDHPVENLAGSGIADQSLSGGDSSEQRRKKSRLITMLDEVYRRYKYYYQQMQAVVASFESVAGLSNAAPYANLALKSMSKHFRSLKNAITHQLQFISKAQNYQRDETPRFGNSDSLYGQRSVHNSEFVEHQPVWRPQRGLPERTVTVLRAWLFEHFLHPYPTDTDKLMLAKQTGLSRSQVSNWFINARVRLWKPMVEEIHVLETRQVQNTLQMEDNAVRPSNPLNIGTSLTSENPFTSTKKAQDLPSKHTRNEFPDISMGTEEPMGLSYENLRHQHMGVGASTAGQGGGVSLTLGLHQNNGIGSSEPFPINAARRFGLDANSGGYVVGSFEAQNRQFGRDIIGGQLLHDFVG